MIFTIALYPLLLLPLIIMLQMMQLCIASSIRHHLKLNSSIPLAFPILTNHFHVTCCNRHRHHRSSTHYYDVLRISPRATHKQIKEAFYQLSKQHHPDASNVPGSAEKFHEIAEAYEVLGNSFKRKKYDRGLIKPGHGRAAEDVSSHGDPEGASKTGPFKTRGPIHTGRTKYYNFDEYYKQHYGETVQQQFKKRHKRASTQDKTHQSKSETDELSHNPEHHHSFDVSSVFFISLCFVVLFFFLTANHGAMKRLEETPKAK